MNPAARAIPRALQRAGIGEDVGDRRGDLVRLVRREVPRGVAAHLGQRGGVRAGDRAAAGHRLERRQPEALVERGEDERGRALVELDELLQPDVPEHLDAVRVLAGVPAPRELEPQLGPVLAQQCEGLEQAGVILVGPRARRVEQKRLARLGRPA